MKTAVEIAGFATLVIALTLLGWSGLLLAMAGALIAVGNRSSAS